MTQDEKKKIGMALLEAEEFLMGSRYEHLPSSVRWYLVVQAASQLACSPKTARKDRKRLADRAFWRALGGLRRTEERKTKNKTYKLSPLLRRIAAADYAAWRRVIISRESELPEWKPYPAEANWEKYLEIGEKEVIQEDVQIEKLGLDTETLAQLALEKNIRKKQEKRNLRRSAFFLETTGMAATMPAKN